MNIRIGVSLLIALVFLFLQRLEAQCYGNPQAESQVCAYTPVTHTAYTLAGIVPIVGRALRLQVKARPLQRMYGRETEMAIVTNTRR